MTAAASVPPQNRHFGGYADMKKKTGRSITFKGIIAGFVNMFILKKMGIVICRLMLGIGRKRHDYVYRAADYLRVSSLELIANEIYTNNVSGNAAELGVFRGDFAKIINIAFPDRKLYLFDTFEGFAEKDIKIEDKVKNSETAQDFSNTNVELVLDKMKHRENCIVKKGYFPQTAEGVEDTFAFVSIDADLYEPIYNGLCYFYPRLVRGGYIFVHDYNDGKTYIRVKEAVKKYRGENNISYFPLSDNQGSAVIMK
jgi:O-methyltransferase